MSRCPVVRWNAQPIKRTTSLKYLGVILGEKLNWISHIQEQGAKEISQYQQLCLITGPRWDYNKNSKGYSTKQFQRGCSFMGLVPGQSLFLPDWKKTAFNTEVSSSDALPALTEPLQRQLCKLL
ncbi:hypothetical protein AVEN_139929-1 [Araneus ventricosus]|uniref:Reverse transcriptase domain-containing protein n=1 Tax=Araneus ventricosus TaxID=182803 RepID=A0A4Y2U5I7_ARAVE|nr:hypothetical protein AVEN_256750-1 [Araneus ventricosus]GBO07892.1 hypothetical protein AVEN_139929-1 [Araneus ventricosus]